MNHNSTGASARSDLMLGKQVLFTTIIIVGLLLAGEVSIRTWAYYFRTSYERYNSHTGRLELVPNIHYRENDGREFRINSRGFVGPEFDEFPPPGTTRMMAIGDSCTFTLGLWQVAYPAVAEHQLNNQGVLGKVEYINAGIEGYNSQFALARVKEELLRYRPHIATIYIGWNDLMKQNPETQVQEGGPTLLGQVMNESYFVKAYKKLIFVYLRPALFKPNLESNEEDRHAYDGYIPKLYETNMRTLIRELKANGTYVILFTLPTVVEPGLTAEQLQERRIFFPYYAGSYSVDRLLSLHDSYNRTIRMIARDEQVPILDLDEEFQKLGKKLDKKPLFWDTMHPSEQGNLVIAGLIVEKIRTLRMNGQL